MPKRQQLIANLVSNLVPRSDQVTWSDLVAHQVAGASGRRSGHGRCVHLTNLPILPKQPVITYGPSQGAGGEREKPIPGS